jgi:hypothetical protein
MPLYELPQIDEWGLGRKPFAPHRGAALIESMSTSFNAAPTVQSQRLWAFFRQRGKHRSVRVLMPDFRMLSEMQAQHRAELGIGHSQHTLSQSGHVAFRGARKNR